MCTQTQAIEVRSKDNGCQSHTHALLFSMPASSCLHLCFVACFDRPVFIASYLGLMCPGHSPRSPDDTPLRNVIETKEA